MAATGDGPCNTCDDSCSVNPEGFAVLFVLFGAVVGFRSSCGSMFWRGPVPGLLQKRITWQAGRSTSLQFCISCCFLFPDLGNNDIIRSATNISLIDFIELFSFFNPLFVLYSVRDRSKQEVRIVNMLSIK